MKDKITKELVKKIFNLKNTISGKDKKELSKFQEIIPLYDIYSHLIYPIHFHEIEDYILNKHYRFLSKPQKQTFKNYLERLKNKKLSIEEKEFKEKIEYNLKIIDNYDLDILEDTSIKAFYYGSSNLGQSISICRRKSFHPSLEHLTPYYSLNELIKMGQNMNMIKNEISPTDLQDEDLHYKICDNISKNDIYAKEILEHKEYLKNNENIIRFFSIYGSYYINQNLRYYQSNNSFRGCPYPEFLKYTKDLNDLFINSPGLTEEYYLYRFIQDDSFLNNIKVGDIFVEAGVMSTTRNPFYSPDELDKFGMILFKITVPKGFDKLLLIESISVFPQEQEIIFPPFTKLKLISKDKNFNYYHTNKKIQETIKKRYHFEIVGQARIPDLPEYNIKEIPTVSKSSRLFAKNFNERKKEFISSLTKSGFFSIKLEKREIRFIAMTFDSSGAYRHVYYNNDEEGLLLYCFEDNAMKYGVEISKELVFNYQERFFPDTNDLSENEMYELLGIIGYLFGYQNAKVYLNYTESNGLIYPKIFDSLKGFKTINFKGGFSERQFNSKINKNINIEKHPSSKFSEKYKTWKEYFDYSKDKSSLKDFYNKWNEEYNEKVLENLYSLIDFDDFYSDNNLQVTKVIINRETNELNRFRQGNNNYQNYN